MSAQNQIGFIYNPLVPEAKPLVEHIASKVSDCWTSIAEPLNIDERQINNTSTIITVGGDGTILRASQIAAPHGIPILGINMGRIGFMTELSVDEAPNRVMCYLEGSPMVEKRMMLQATVHANSEPHTRTMHALNDVVVNRGHTARILDIEARVNDTLVTTYRADGVIVATATGSTGYSLAAGGPVLYPESDLILMQPLAAHIGFNSGLVLLGDHVINLSLHGTSEATLSTDVKTHTLNVESTVSIQRSPYSTLFLRHGDRSKFYASLATRLAGNSRAKT